MTRSVLVTWLAATLAVLAPVAVAQAGFPDRPVRIILPFGAGGIADVTARIVADRLSDRLGQRFLVENMPGAGGIQAARAVADNVLSWDQEEQGGPMTLVRYESVGHVATITMDRAAAHNALNNALCDELRAAWLRFRDSDHRVAVLASAEEAYFSVGADVRDLPANMWHAVPGLGVELDKPVIAATSGWVVGGGFVLVQMADMCVASQTTRFLYPEARIGTTGGGIASVLTRMPHKVAMEFLLVGEELAVERAYQVGFVNRITPSGQHVAIAQEMAAKIAGNAPLVVQALKKLARDTMPRGPLDTVADARRVLDTIRESDDLKEGVAAFREKRKPEFKGK